MSATNGTLRKELAALDAHLAKWPERFGDELIDPDQREQEELRRVHLEKLLSLEERLQKAGIDPADLAELLWFRVANLVEGDIHKFALEAVKDAVRQRLEGVRLTAIISSADIERKIELEE